MARIHVRLNLEDEPGETSSVGLDDARIAQARLRRRRELDQRLQERLEAEVRQRAAEKHRRLPTGAILGEVERRAGVANHVERLAELRVEPVADHLLAPPGSSSDDRSTGARCCPCASRS